MYLSTVKVGCEGEAHNGAGSNTVTLPGPKGGSNGEYKADLHTGGVLSTRPPIRVILSTADLTKKRIGIILAYHTA